MISSLSVYIDVVRNSYNCERRRRRKHYPYVSPSATFVAGETKTEDDYTLKIGAWIYPPIKIVTYGFIQIFTLVNDVSKLLLSGKLFQMCANKRCACYMVHLLSRHLYRFLHVVIDVSDTKAFPEFFNNKRREVFCVSSLNGFKIKWCTYFDDNFHTREVLKPIQGTEIIIFKNMVNSKSDKIQIKL